jgi:hypothetical protein
MKHLKLLRVFNQRLKLFEGFKEEDYYVEIGFEDVINGSMDPDIISFTKKKSAKKLHREMGIGELTFNRENSLLTWLDDLGYDSHWDYNRKPKLKTRAQISEYDEESNDETYIVIWEMKDEFFLVFIDILHNGDSVDDGHFYKCDQWEGVEKLIKDKLI